MYSNKDEILDPPSIELIDLIAPECTRFSLIFQEYGAGSY